MSSPDEDIRIAVASGLSVVCGTCRKYREALERGLDKCLAVDGCGSPIIGDTFHEYDGPITNFLSLCFVCGSPPKKAIRVKGHVRLIGACEKHVEYVATLAPQTLRPPSVVPRTVLSGSGEEAAAESLIGKPKKSLEALIAEVEKKGED